MDALRFDNVHRRHGSTALPMGLRRPRCLGGRTHVVLAGFDLSIQAGERVALVGANGAGKSTVLRLAAGLEAPDTGRVHVFGDAPTGSRARHARARIGFAPEGFPFPPELRADAALHLMASLQGIPRDARSQAVTAGLESVRLGAATRTRLGAFSAGMRRRFALAQATFHHPDLVLLDEPTLGLDAEGYDALAGLLERAESRGATLVFASHAPDFVRAAAQELVVLVEGRVARRATAQELFRDGIDLATLGRLYRDLPQAKAFETTKPFPQRIDVNLDR